MLTKRGFDRLAGILFISIFVAFAVALLFGGTEVNWDRDKIEESLADVIDNQEIYFTNQAFFLLGGLTLITAAGPLFLLFRPHGRELAIFGLVGLLTSGVIICMATAVNISLTILARDFVDGVVASPDALLSTARAFAFLGVAVPFATAFTLLGLGVISIGLLILQRRAFPRWMGWWAIVSGALLLSAFALASDSDVAFIGPGVGGAGALFFFLFLGIWLLKWGSPEVAAD